MKISILIANYNNGKYFYDCYKSIINQTYTNWEVIIVDDKSTDESLLIINAQIKNDDRFKILALPENKGVGYVKRELIDLAKGEIAAFLDPDDVLMPKALSLLVNKLKVENNLVAAYTNYYLCDSNLNNCVLKPNKPFGLRQQNSFWKVGIGSINPLFAFRLDAYKKTKGINPQYRIGEDIDLYLKLEEIGPIYHLQEPGYRVRRHSQSLTADLKKCKHWIWVLRVLYETGQRRVENKLMNYRQYVSKIVDQIIFYLEDCKGQDDRETFLTIRKEFFSHPFNFKLFLHPVFFKYVVKHYKSFIWTQ